jgi:hypothetical protein
MASHRSEGRISRRGMLKRLGAGAAVAWSAPVLTSLRTPAFAQYPARCTESSQCGAIVFCGEECFCTSTVEGDAVHCQQDFFCGTQPTCTSSAECQAQGFEYCRAAGTGCCPGAVCVFMCFGTASAVARGNTDSGR